MRHVELVHTDVKGTIRVLERQVPQHEASGWKRKPTRRTRKTRPPQDPDQQQED
jgi:hypothetical protein